MTWHRECREKFKQSRTVRNSVTSLIVFSHLQKHLKKFLLQKSNTVNVDVGLTLVASSEATSSARLCRAHSRKARPPGSLAPAASSISTTCTFLARAAIARAVHGPSPVKRYQDFNKTYMFKL